LQHRIFSQHGKEGDRISKEIERIEEKKSQNDQFIENSKIKAGVYSDGNFMSKQDQDKV